MRGSPPLPVFPRASRLVGEAFGAALRASRSPVVCYCEPATATAAVEYLEDMGCAQAARLVVCPAGVPLAELERHASADDGHLVLFVLAALDPGIKDRFFGHPRVFMFADHHYTACGDHESPSLFTVGTTEGSMARLVAPSAAGERAERLRRVAALRARHQNRYLGPHGLGDVLRSPAVRVIRIHGLGPSGTNIARACELYAASEGVRSKTALVIHERKVEPFDYARMAAAEVRPGVLPLHVECAVFYGLRDLFQSRPDEVVLAGHLYMPLDEMQLAARDQRGPSAGASGQLRIAAHPSPVGLVRAWCEAGVARHLVASSNADAAHMVRLGEADLCITTESARRIADLRAVHCFGSPTMLFTIGASTSNRRLRELLRPAPSPREMPVQPASLLGS